MGEHVNNAQADLLLKVGTSHKMAYAAKIDANAAHGIGVTGLRAEKGNAGCPVVDNNDKIAPRRSHGLERLWLRSPSPSLMVKLEKWVEKNRDTLKSLSVLVRGILTCIS